MNKPQRPIQPLGHVSIIEFLRAALHLPYVVGIPSHGRGARLHNLKGQHSKTMNPVIVVIAYNRLESLKRLLQSIDAAQPPQNTTLVISVDHSDTDTVEDYAQRFCWGYGEKRVIAHQSNLGLRDHVLSCGDLASEYGAVILLEDDLYVSPQFFDFAREALDYYSDDSRVAGISLYNHCWNETARQKFTTLELTSSDCYLLQIASSWGQAWTHDQWKKFRNWYQANSEWSCEGLIPNDVNRWPESSWKKYFIKYLIETDRYFIYPKLSFSTNFSEIGVHHKERHSVLQVPLELRKRRLKFLPFDDIQEKYDAFCELHVDSFKRICPYLEGYDVEIDLYGSKPSNAVRASFLLTSKQCVDPKMSYAMALKPHEVNVALGLTGSEFHLAPTTSCSDELTTSFPERARFYFDIHVSYDAVLVKATEERISLSAQERTKPSLARRAARRMKRSLKRLLHWR